MDKEIITKEFKYKGHTKSFSVEVQQLPDFDPLTMDETQYEEAKKECFIEAEADLYNQKTEWFFEIEHDLRK